MGFFKETPCHTYVTLGGERVKERLVEMAF